MRIQFGTFQVLYFPTSAIFPAALPPLVDGQDFWMAARSSWSAWSISSMLLMKICRLILMRENRVDLKWTLPSSSTGMFILTSLLYANRSGHLLPKPNGGSIWRENIEL